MNIIPIAETIKKVCVICGGYHNVNNCDFIKITKHIPDNKIPTKAKSTLPNFLQLQILTDGSYSVVTKSFIEKGTQFGPLKAEKTDTLDPSVVFPLKIFSTDENTEVEYYLDIHDENKCSWLMFVSSADNVDEQNLICYQERGQIFYLAIKPISVGETLKVWYSSFYAQKMNKAVLNAKPVESDPLKNIDVNTLIKKQQKIMERKMWTCKFCGQMENNIVSFAKHMIKHYSNQLRRNCEICKKTFGSKKGLTNHLKIVHNLNSQPNESKSKQVFLKKPSSNNLTLGDPLLNDIFTDSSDLQQTELNQFDINIDNQSLLLENDNLIAETFLNENVKDLDHFNFEIDDNQKQFVCDVCLKQFSKLKLLLIHMKHHTGDFMCIKCLKIFCRRENLKSHMCNSSQFFSCNLCQKKFTQSKYLSRHMVAQHSKKYLCKICNTRYYSNKELQDHNCSKLPNEIKQKFTCSLCSKQFYRLSYLKKHMLIHIPRTHTTKVQSVVCEVCGTTLLSKSSYYLHMKIHANPTFSCNICDKKFCRQDALNKHLLFHGPGEEYKCEKCDKILKTTKNLKIHMRSHISRDYHKCNLCPAVFTQRSTLNRHIKKKHTGKSETISELYWCEFCNKSLKLRSSMMRHIKKMHSNRNVNIGDVKSIPVKLTENGLKVIEPDKSQNENLKSEIIVPNKLNGSIASTVQSADLVIGTDDIVSQEKKVNKEVKEVCLSIPDLTEIDQEITLDKNAYILENGTIVQPQANSDNVIMYVLDQTFTS